MDVRSVLCRFQCAVVRLSAVHIAKVQQSMLLEIEISSGKVTVGVVADPQRGTRGVVERGRVLRDLRS